MLGSGTLRICTYVGGVGFDLASYSEAWLAILHLYPFGIA